MSKRSRDVAELIERTQNARNNTRIEENGFFEGVYDHQFEGIKRAYSDDELAQVFPYTGRWDQHHARPIPYDFSPGVERHLGRLAFPWTQTNQLVQVGLQYRLDPDEQKPVPDGYMIRYSRLGRLGKGDIDKSLMIAVIRSNIVDELVATKATDSITPSWQKVAQKGKQFGNAILAYHLSSDSSRGVITQTSMHKDGGLLPADEALAGTAFETIAYWQP